MKKPLQRSFTLMEILVYIAVLSIVITAIVSFVLWFIHSNTKTKAMRETLDNARRVMEIMTYEIKEARSIYAPTTTSTQLSLETTKYLPEGEETSFIDFYLCDYRLCLKKESRDSIALTSDSVEINNLVFTRIVSGEVPSIQIDLTIDYKNPTNRPEYQASVGLKSTVSLREY
ncbi:type II secretion system protein [Patescibacteria group bacterium]|nr:type II secretion system protein [Patescibacteria group bacterium]